MNPSPKTIQIFLPGGDARGIRVAELTTPIVQVEISFENKICQHLGAHGWHYAKAQRVIELLQERRTALISAAVTGQIDVRQSA
jgi:hypothetical protein